MSFGWDIQILTTSFECLPFSGSAWKLARSSICWSHGKQKYWSSSMGMNRNIEALKSVKFFWPKYQLGCPENYLFRISNKIQIGSNFPKKSWFKFEKGFNGCNTCWLVQANSWRCSSSSCNCKMRGGSPPLEAAMATIGDEHNMPRGRASLILLLLCELVRLVGLDRTQMTWRPALIVVGSSSVPMTQLWLRHDSDMTQDFWVWTGQFGSREST